MKGKHIAAVGAVALGFHVVALMADAERYRANLARWRASSTSANFMRLLLAEGILIKDLGWLL